MNALNVTRDSRSMMALNAIVMSRVAQTERSIIARRLVLIAGHTWISRLIAPYDQHRRGGRHAPTAVLISDMSARSIGLLCRSIGEGGRVDPSARVNGNICGVECILSRVYEFRDVRAALCAVSRVLRSGTARTIDIALTLIRRVRNTHTHTHTRQEEGKGREGKGRVLKPV